MHSTNIRIKFNAFISYDLLVIINKWKDAENVHTPVTFLLYIPQKYSVHINYRRILPNHIFTNTEHKYMLLLPFERGMFAVP